MARSQQELAEIHGVSQQSVSRWIADPRWAEAGFRTNPPWSIAEIARQREWRVQTLQENRATVIDDVANRDGEDLSDLPRVNGNLGRMRMIAQIKKLVAQEQLLQLEIAIKRSEYVRREEAEDKQAMKIRALRVGMEQIPKALRQPFAEIGADPEKTQTLLEDALRTLCMEGIA
jgi:hypothetical protein